MLIAALTLLGILTFVGGSIAGLIHFYWKLKDRRVKPISDHQDWFINNWEGRTIHGENIKGTISDVRCYPPNSRLNKLKRYLLFDEVRIEVTLILQPGVPDRFWDETSDLVEEDDVEVQHYDTIPKQGQSYIRLEINTRSPEYFEEVVNLPIVVIDEYLKSRFGDSVSVEN